jgi:hypothetical protein
MKIDDKFAFIPLFGEENKKIELYDIFIPLIKYLDT